MRDGLRRACCACAGKEEVVRAKAVLRSRVFGCGSYGGYVCVIFLEVLAALVRCWLVEAPSLLDSVLLLFGVLLVGVCSVPPSPASFLVLFPSAVAGSRNRPGWAPV